MTLGDEREIIRKVIYEIIITSHYYIYVRAIMIETYTKIVKSKTGKTIYLLILLFSEL